MVTAKVERLSELEEDDKFWALRMAVELREAVRKRRAHAEEQPKSRLVESLVAEVTLDPLTDQEAEEMVRLLIRYHEVDEQRRDELLAWLDTVTVKRRLLEES